MLSCELGASMKRWFCAALILLGLAPSALGWSAKEHIQMTRLAVRRLADDASTPEAMKQWLVKGCMPLYDMEGERRYLMTARVGQFPRGVDGLPFWSVYPDLLALAERQDRPAGLFGVPERKLHFIDAEEFAPAASLRRYADDLSGRPPITAFPRDPSDARYQAAGMLPFAVEHHYRQLVRALKEGRLDDMPGRYPRDDHAVRWAGTLAHYLADSTQPHHGTRDYKSRSYFPATVAAPDVHSDLEARLVDDDREDYPELRAQYWKALVAALEEPPPFQPDDDVWTATLKTVLTSYEALPVIGRAARAAYPDATSNGPGRWRAEVFFGYKGRYLGRERSVLEIKAHQQAWGIRLIETLWRRAWEQAARP